MFIAGPRVLTGYARCVMKRPRHIKTLEERLWDHLEPGDPDECWPWTGTIRPNGYGVIGHVGGVGGPQVLAHRAAYSILRGPIPEDRQIDHECHNRDESCVAGEGCLHRRCCNPAHLEPKTPQANTLAGRTLPAANAVKTHCPAGHEYTEANTYVEKRRGLRHCRKCHRDAERRRRTRLQGG